MVTVYNDKKKRIFSLSGNPEALLRQICEQNPTLFTKESDDALGKIKFTSLSSTEAKINIGNVYLWKDYTLYFEVV